MKDQTKHIHRKHVARDANFWAAKIRADQRAKKPAQPAPVTFAREWKK